MYIDNRFVSFHQARNAFPIPKQLIDAETEVISRGSGTFVRLEENVLKSVGIIGTAKV